MLLRVDGLGNTSIMDVQTCQLCWQLTHLGSARSTVRSTKLLVPSDDFEPNPYFYEEFTQKEEAVSSSHTFITLYPGRLLYPSKLTTADKAEKILAESVDLPAILEQVSARDFHVDDPTKYSREMVYSWPMMFCGGLSCGYSLMS